MKSIAARFALAGAMVLLAITVQAADPKSEGSSKPNGTSSELFADKVVARGKGFEIRQSQVEEMYVSFKANRAANGQRIPDAMRPKIQADILDKLISTQLCLKRATDADRAKGKEISEQFIAEQLKQAPSQESFNRQLTAVGMSPEEFRTQIAEQAIVKAVLDREVRDLNPVTDADAKKFYDENPKLFVEPEMVRITHILFATQDAQGHDLTPEQKAEKKRSADSVLAKAKAGEDFTKLVKEFSDDKPSVERGGEYTIARAKDDPRRAVVPEFEAAAFSLALNQVSDIVTTRYGYHIIKLLEKIAPKTIEFTKILPKIKDTLTQETVQKQLPAYLEKLKKEAGVEILSKPGE